MFQQISAPLTLAEVPIARIGVLMVALEQSVKAMHTIILIRALFRQCLPPILLFGGVSRMLKPIPYVLFFDMMPVLEMKRVQSPWI